MQSCECQPDLRAYSVVTHTGTDQNQVTQQGVHTNSLTGHFREKMNNLVHDYFREKGLTFVDSELVHAAVGYLSHHLLGCAHNDERMEIILNQLGSMYLERYQQSGMLESAGLAIELFWHSVELGDGSEFHPMVLTNLAQVYKHRYDHLGNTSDFEIAMRCQTRALTLLPQDHSARLSFLNVLANILQSRFRREGHVEDIYSAIEIRCSLLKTAADSNRLKPSWLMTLGNAYALLYQHANDIMALNQALETFVEALSLVSANDPCWHHIVSNLGLLLNTRFSLLGNIKDLDRAIELGHLAVALLDEEHPDRPDKLNALGLSYCYKTWYSNDVSDLQSAIDLFLEAELGAPDTHPNKTYWLAHLGQAYIRLYVMREHGPHLDAAIHYLRKALSLSSCAHPRRYLCFNYMGTALRMRYSESGNIEDIDAAIDLQIKHLAPRLSNRANSYIQHYELAQSYLVRFERLGQNDDVESSLKYLNLVLAETSDSSPSKPALYSMLGQILKLRFHYSGELEDIHMAINYVTKAESLMIRSGRRDPQLLSVIALLYLTRFQSLREQEDLEIATRYQSAVVSYKLDGRSSYELGRIYVERFASKGRNEDLDAAISYLGKAHSMIPQENAEQCGILRELGLCHTFRLEVSQKLDTIETALNCFRQSALVSTATPAMKFASAYSWARISFQFGFSSTGDAYRYLMDLIPQIIWLGVPVVRRWDLMTHIGSAVTEAAATALENGHFTTAFEWLGEGKSVVWGQVIRLRSSPHELSVVNQQLAKRLQDVAFQLDCASSATSDIKHLSNDGVMLEESAQRHRRLALRWQKTIDEIRQLSGFHDFMKPKKFDEIREVAVSTTVVLINVNRYRCDALALTASSEGPIHIPLPMLSLESADSLRKRLLCCLEGATSRNRLKRRPVYPQNSPDDQIEETLAELWSCVVEPILSGLNLMQISAENELARITWCPTGPLAFLPLHAAGIYQECSTRVYNYVVSSYTPTLSALLQPEKPRGFRGILTVGQEATAGFEPLPGTAIELDQIQHQADGCGLRFIRLDKSGSTPGSVLEKMKETSWVHLACHASQDNDDPSRSAFHLHDGKLELTALLNESLKHAEFAFLSACQTATGHGMLPDEAIHLAAGMLMAGYRSVIATMWSIKDEDAPTVVREFYSRVLKDNVPNSRNSARAIHDAVGKLREQVGERSFERWAPFIHMGL